MQERCVDHVGWGGYGERAQESPFADCRSCDSCLMGWVSSGSARLAAVFTSVQTPLHIINLHVKNLDASFK